MSSVRLHHPLLKSSAGARITYAVELMAKPMPAKHTRSCNACSQPGRPVVHKYKTIHLRMDENGDTFVSDGILELLRTVPTTAGLEVVPGRNAPPQAIGAVEQPQQEIILANGQGHYVPEVRETDAVVRMRKPFQPFVEAVREQLDRTATAERMKKAKMFIISRRK
jgi:hypothetical protein